MREGPQQSEVTPSLTFERQDTPTVMDGLVVRYKLVSDLHDGQINASRNGVGVLGRWPIMTTEQTVAFEEQLARVRVQHNHLSVERGIYARVAALTEAEIDRLLGPIPLESE